MSTTALTPIVGPQAHKSLLTIQKATVKKQLLTAEFTEQLDLESKPRAFTMQGTELVHPDLETCFAQLVPHFCLLTEQLAEHDSYHNGYWPEGGELPNHFEGFQVTGLVIGRKDGVTLLGQRIMASGKVLNLTSQYASFADTSEEFEESDAWHYAHTDDLKALVAAVLAEVEAALRGKCSEAGRQLDMFQEQQEADVYDPQVGALEMGEASSPAPRRKARRANTTAAE